MKRAISILLVLCLLFNFTIVAYANTDPINEFQQHVQSDFNDTTDSLKNQIDSATQKYSENVLMLYNTDYKRAIEIADSVSGTLHIFDNCDFAQIKLPDNVSVSDIANNEKYSEYHNELYLDFCAQMYDNSSSYTNTEVSLSSEEIYPNTEYINLGSVWEKSKGAYADGSKVSIAIIDSGIDIDHPDFFDKNGNSIISNKSYNATEHKTVEEYGLDIIDDKNGHGTRVASIIAAQENGVGMVGIAPEAEIIIIKCNPNSNGMISSSDLFSAFIYASDLGVDIINMSNGIFYTSFDELTDNQKYFFSTFNSEMIKAKKNGTYVIAAAGNIGNSGYSFPANYVSTIGVGALDKNSYTLAAYSGYGDNSDVVAPGTVYAASLNGTYGEYTGTSYSCPIVSAVTALFISQNKGVSFNTLKEKLEVSSDDLGDVGHDDKYSFGLINANDFINGEYGYITYDYCTDELVNTKQLFLKNSTIQKIISTPSRADYDLEGWYLDAEYTERFDEIAYFTTEFKNDTTLYAKWGEYSPESSDVFTYTKNSSGKITITKYSGSRWFVKIPQTIDGYPVTSVSNYAFSDSPDILVVSVPSSVSVYPYAFNKCNKLTVISDGKVLYDDASYMYRSICTNVISYGFTDYGQFYTLRKDGTICVAKYIGNNPNIVIPETIRGYPVTEIAQGAFNTSDQPILSIDIPNTIKSIGNKAFGNLDELTSITIPDSVTTFGTQVFRNSNKLKNVVFPKGITEIADYMFYSCTGLTEIIIPDTVTTIGEKAFCGCDALKYIYLPESVTQIYRGAFDDCYNLSIMCESNTLPVNNDNNWSNEFNAICLNVDTYGFTDYNQLYAVTKDSEITLLKYYGSETEVTIPNSINGLPVTRISDDAFSKVSSGNSDLTKITIPEGITEIGQSAFYNCDKLKDVDIPSTVKLISNYAFANCASISELKLPTSLTEISRYMFYGCTGITAFEIPDHITVINNSAFKKCTNLSSVFIPDSVTALGNDAFYDCTSLDSVNIPKSITELSDSLFYNCDSLVSITIPETITSIEANVFGSCNSLKSVTLPKTITTIPDRLFSGCSNLESIVIPDNVTSIENYAFAYCSNIKSITIPNKVTSIGEYAFTQCTGLITVGLPTGLQEIKAYAFNKCTNLTDISVPDSVTSIGGGIFCECSSIKTISLNGNITSIGGLSFYNCTSLKSIYLSGTIQTIGNKAFLKCSELTDVYFNTIESEVTIEVNSNNTEFTNATKHYTSNSITGQAGSNATFTYDTDTGVLTYTGIGTLWVSGINDSTSNNVKEVILLDGITGISNVFDGNKFTSLEKVTLPEGITTIANGAFSNCKTLVEINFPSTLLTIGDYAFYNCTSLKSLYFPVSLHSIGKNAFTLCNSLTDIYFNGQQEEVSIDVGESNTQYHTTPKHYALTGNIGTNANYCFYQDVGLLILSGTGTLWGPGIDVASRGYVKEAVIKEGITGINNIFNGNYFTNLEKVTLPDGFISIGDSAFAGCKKLSMINLPSSLKTIGEYAFYINKSIKSITIPENVTSIGNNAFLGIVASDINYTGTRNQWKTLNVGSGNTRLSFVKCTNEIRTILNSSKGDGAWIFNEESKTLYFSGGTGFIKSYTEGAEMVPDEIAAKVTCIDIDETLGGFGAYTFSNMKNVHSVIGGENIRYVGNCAFKNCTALTRVFFTSAQYFGGVSYGLFNGCTSLSIMTLGNNVKYIYGRAFQNCKMLESVTIPSSVNAIGEYAFYNCTRLYKLKINNGVTTLGAGAIQGCTSMQNIYIPESLTVIGAYSFYNVHNSLTVHYAGTEAKWSIVYVKTGNSMLKTLTVKCN